MDAIAAAARDAPTTPGVYFMLTADRELVYIGKAGNLRRRLQQHAKAAVLGETPRDVKRATTVTDVRWEETPTEADAADREADLVVSLSPALNASMATDGRWTFLDVDRRDSGLIVRLTTDPSTPVVGRRYGAFPHLGPGGSSARGDACTAGLAGLLRLVWSSSAVDERATCPAAIAGPSVRGPQITVALPDATPALSAGLSRFFGGSSAAVIDGLLSTASEVRPRYARPALRADAASAHAFFDHGPRVLRDLRRRHGLDARPLTRQEITSALTAEVEAIVGPFTVMGADEAADRIVGSRRSRAIAQRSRRVM